MLLFHWWLGWIVFAFLCGSFGGLCPPQAAWGSAKESERKEGKQRKANPTAPQELVCEWNEINQRQAGSRSEWIYLIHEWSKQRQLINGM